MSHNLTEWRHAKIFPGNVMSKLSSGAAWFTCATLLSMAGMGTGMAATPSSPPRIDMQLAEVSGQNGQARAIAVTYSVSVAPGEAPPTSFVFDTLSPSLLRVDDQVTGLAVTDEKGPVPLAAPVIRKDTDAEHQVWSTSRPTVGVVHVAYTVPVARALTPKRGPHLDLQAAGGGLSGAFVGFMLLPEIKAKDVQLSLHWQLPAGHQAVSSLGNGDANTRISFDKLNFVVFLAGSLQKPVLNDGSKNFAVYALGMEPSQLDALATWTAKAYEVERKAFKVPADKPYNFLVRSYEGGGQDSGRASEGAFMLYLPSGYDTSKASLHFLVAHEMVHSLIASFDDVPADGGLWYTEGAAEYFSVKLPNDAGLYSARDYLATINEMSASYYSNALRNVPDERIPSVMWTGRNAWIVPYNRGFMYLANLEASLRAHHASVTVLDLTNEASRRIRAGAASNDRIWEGVLKDKVAPWALDDWHAMMAGRLILPPADTFGACVVGTRKQVGLFDLGFDKPVRLDAGGVISGVKAGSPAARAGLQDGDVLSAAVDIYPLFMSLDTPAKLSVMRAGKPLTIQYDPHRDSVPGMTWLPASGNRDHPCADTGPAKSG